MLRVTNELNMDMIKIQHWKIYASHYNDESLGIGDELKNLQFQYCNYEGMGVPVQGYIIDKSRKPNIDDSFPYFHDRSPQTKLADYEDALRIERSNCCVTKIEYGAQISEQISKQRSESSSIDEMCEIDRRLVDDISEDSPSQRTVR